MKTVKGYRKVKYDEACLYLICSDLSDNYHNRA